VPHKRHKRPKNYVGVFRFWYLKPTLLPSEARRACGASKKEILGFGFPFYARSAHVNEQRADAQASVRCELAQEERKSFEELLPISGFLYKSPPKWQQKMRRQITRLRVFL